MPSIYWRDFSSAFHIDCGVSLFLAYLKVQQIVRHKTMQRETQNITCHLSYRFDNVCLAIQISTCDSVKMMNSDFFL